MRFTTHINNQRCLEWGLTANQGALFDFLNQASSWAEPVSFMGDVFYWVSRTKVLEELPLFYTKSDTVYRNLKQLERKGLIYFAKDGAKDLVKLTQKGRKWNEISADFDIKKLGSKSELGSKSDQTRIQIRNNSDLDPTYNNTIDNNININDNAEQVPVVEISESEKLANYFLSEIRKLKANFKQPNLKTWSNQINVIIDTDKKTIDEIKAVFDFAIKNEYWQQIMLSPSLVSKLRFNWDQLEFKASKQEVKQKANNPELDADELSTAGLPTAGEVYCNVRANNNKKYLCANVHEYSIMRKVVDRAFSIRASDDELKVIIGKVLAEALEAINQGTEFEQPENLEVFIFI